MGACGAKLDQGDESSEYSDDDSYLIEDSDDSTTQTKTKTKRKSMAMNGRFKNTAPFTNPVDSDTDDLDDGASSSSSKTKNFSPVSITDAISSNVDPLGTQEQVRQLYHVERPLPPKILSPDDLFELLKSFYKLCDPSQEESKIKKQVSKYHNDTKALQKYVSKKYNDEFPHSVQEFSEKLMGSIKMEEKMTAEKSSKDGKSGALPGIKRPTLSGKALKELAQAQFKAAKKRRQERAHRNARISECREQIRNLDASSTDYYESYVGVLKRSLVPGQRVKLCDGSANLYLKPGNLGTYLHPFQHDPENTGLFEWIDWIHPLSNRSVLAVPYVHVEVDEEPNTDDEGADGSDDDVAVANLERKMTAAGINLLHTDTADTTTDDSDDGEKFGDVQQVPDEDSDDLDAIAGENVDISTPKNADKDKSPSKFIVRSCRKYFCHVIGSLRILVFRIGPESVVKPDDVSGTPKSDSAPPSPGQSKMKKTKTLTPAQLIMSRIMAVEQANTPRERSMSDSSGNSTSDSDADDIVAQRMQARALRERDERDSDDTSDEEPPVPPARPSKKPENPFESSDAEEEQATGAGADHQGNPFETDGTGAQTDDAANPFESDSEEEPQTAKPQNPFADDSTTDSNPFAADAATNNPFADDAEDDTTSNNPFAEEVEHGEDATTTKSDNPFADSEVSAEDAEPSKEAQNQGATQQEGDDDFPRLGAELAENEAAVQTLKLLKDGAISRNEFDNIIASMTAASREAADEPLSDDDQVSEIEKVAAQQLKQGIISQEEHDLIVSKARQATLPSPSAGPRAQTDSSASPQQDTQTNPFDNSDEEPPPSENPFASSDEEDTATTIVKKTDEQQDEGTPHVDGAHATKPTRNPFSDSDSETVSDSDNEAADEGDGIDAPTAETSEPDDPSAPTAAELKLLALIGDDEDFNVLMYSVYESVDPAAAAEALMKVASIPHDQRHLLLRETIEKYGEPARVIIEGTAAEETARKEKWTKLAELVHETETFLAEQRGGGLMHDKADDQVDEDSNDEDPNDSPGMRKIRRLYSGTRRYLCHAGTGAVFDFATLRLKTAALDYSIADCQTLLSNESQPTQDDGQAHPALIAKAKHVQKAAFALREQAFKDAVKTLDEMCDLPALGDMEEGRELWDAQDTRIKVLENGAKVGRAGLEELENGYGDKASEHLRDEYLQDLEDLLADITASLEDLIVDREVRLATSQREEAWGVLIEKLHDGMAAARDSMDVGPLQLLIAEVAAAPGADDTNDHLPATHADVMRARALVTELGEQRQSALAHKLKDEVSACVKREDAAGIDAIIAKFLEEGALDKDNPIYTSAAHQAERVRARVLKKRTAQSKSFHSKQIKARVKQLRKATLAAEAGDDAASLQALKHIIVSCQSVVPTFKDGAIPEGMDPSKVAEYQKGVPETNSAFESAQATLQRRQKRCLEEASSANQLALRVVQELESLDQNIDGPLQSEPTADTTEDNDETGPDDTVDEDDGDETEETDATPVSDTKRKKKSKRKSSKGKKKKKSKKVKKAGKTKNSSEDKYGLPTDRLLPSAAATDKILDELAATLLAVAEKGLSKPRASVAPTDKRGPTETRAWPSKKSSVVEKDSSTNTNGAEAGGTDAGGAEAGGTEANAVAVAAQKENSEQADVDGDGTSLEDIATYFEASEKELVDVLDELERNVLQANTVYRDLLTSYETRSRAMLAQTEETYTILVKEGMSSPMHKPAAHIMDLDRPQKLDTSDEAVDALILKAENFMDRMTAFGLLPPAKTRMSMDGPAPALGKFDLGDDDIDSNVDSRAGDFDSRVMRELRRAVVALKRSKSLGAANRLRKKIEEARKTRDNVALEKELNRAVDAGIKEDDPSIEMAFELMKELVRSEKVALKKLQAFEQDVQNVLDSVAAHHAKYTKQFQEMDKVTGGTHAQTPSTRTLRQAKMKTQGCLRQIEKLQSTFESEALELAHPAKKVKKATKRVHGMFARLNEEWMPKLQELRVQVAERLKVPLTPASSSARERASVRAGLTTSRSFAERKQAYLEQKFSVDLMDDDSEDSSDLLTGTDSDDDSSSVVNSPVVTLKDLPNLSLSPAPTALKAPKTNDATVTDGAEPVSESTATVAEEDQPKPVVKKENDTDTTKADGADSREKESAESGADTIAAKKSNAAAKPKTKKPKQKTISKKSSKSSVVFPWLAVGRKVKVQVVDGGSSLVGTVRYIGKTSFSSDPNFTWVGVELDEPKGTHDGEVEGHRYFSCPPKHGLFVLESATAPVKIAKTKSKKIVRCDIYVTSRIILLLCLTGVRSDEALLTSRFCICSVTRPTSPPKLRRKRKRMLRTSSWTWT